MQTGFSIRWKGVGRFERAALLVTFSQIPIYKIGKSNIAFVYAKRL
jgi:hypothetical protein